MPVRTAPLSDAILVVAETEELALKWMRCSGTDPARCDVAVDPYYVTESWVVTDSDDIEVEVGRLWVFDEYDEVVYVGEIVHAVRAAAFA